MSNINIIDPGLSFSSLTKRTTTKYLILHHAAAENTSAQTIHQWHKSNGWAGIGYNFYIRQDGTVYKGRGWEYVGSHATNYNSKSLGICFEGNFESTSKSMPSVQYNSGVKMIALALEKYPTISTICGHKSVGSTACPGKYFPLDKIIAAGKSGETSSGSSDAKSGASDTDSNGCPYGTSTTMVKNGSTGTAVYRCQWYLNKANNAGLTVDGICGSKTEAAIKAFQSSKGLTVDGICGSKTWAALESAVSALGSSSSASSGETGDTDSNGCPYGTITATVKRGSTGTAVYRCQWYLNKANNAGLAIDGICGSKTKAAIKAFQTSKGLTVDGTCGPITWAALESAVSALSSSGSISAGRVETAIDILTSAGVIGTPGYWLENYGKLQYLDQLLVNMSALTYKSAAGDAITTVEKAIAKLESAGAINSPEYWTANYSKLQYFDQLLIKAANKL